MSTRYERKPNSITVYGADWCGDCIRAKAFFDENEISFHYVDLVEHPHEADEILERNGGVQKIPLVIFPDDSFLIEPTNAQLKDKMGELAAVEKSPERSSANNIFENSDEGRFELHIDGEIVSMATYSERDDGTVVVPHVETIPAHRGQGHAGRLVDGVVAKLRASDRKIVPLCPFAASHIDQNPEHQDVLAG